MTFYNAGFELESVAATKAVETAEADTKEVRERAIKMVYDHFDEYPSKWAAIYSFAEKLPMTAETFLTRVARAKIDQGELRRLATGEKKRLRAGL